MRKNRNRPCEELAGTTNRNLFNKLRKRILAQRRAIRCSYCRYNRGENDKNNWYGTRFSWAKMAHGETKYPNWKLVSKKRKQWMPGTYQIEERKGMYRTYIKIKF